MQLAGFFCNRSHLCPWIKVGGCMVGGVWGVRPKPDQPDHLLQPCVSHICHSEVHIQEVPPSPLPLNIRLNVF